MGYLRSRENLRYCYEAAQWTSLPQAVTCGLRRLHALAAAVIVVQGMQRSWLRMRVYECQLYVR